MGTRNRLQCGALVASLCAIATLAVAQPSSKSAPKQRPVPRPAGVLKNDAGPAVIPTHERVPDDLDASSKLAAVEPPPADIGDGGRLSPLTPAPQEFPGAVADAGTPVDYDRLLAEIAALRARVAAVSDTLYQSRVAVSIQVDGSHGTLSKLTVSLDNGIVWTAPPSFAASDGTVVYDHAVAPGRHAVTIDADRKDDRDESFRSSQRSRFTLDVPRDQRVEVQVRVGDDSTMGADFPSDHSGKYDLRFRVKAVSKPAGK